MPALRRYRPPLILFAALVALIALVIVVRALDPPPAAAPVVNRAFPSGPATPTAVWAVGDGDSDEASAGLVERIVAARPDRFLYLGDVYERGTPGDFLENYGPTFGRLASITAPTPGNHDWPRHLTGYDPYWRSKTGFPTPPWYAFRLAGWELLSLNSQADHGADSEQLRWLRGHLGRRPGTCRLAFWHRPRFNAGEHDDQVDVQPFWDALRGRAVLVLNGHDHNVQRFRPVNGITQIIAGAGGRSRYEVDAADPRLAFARDGVEAALRLDLRPGRAAVTVISSGGRVLDRSSLRCRRER